MTRVERNRLAAYVFSEVFGRESNLPAQDRLEAAVGAAIDVGLARNPAIAARVELRKPPIVVDQVAELLLWNRARKTIESVARNHGLTPDALLGGDRDPEVGTARDEAYYLLAHAAEPLSQRQIATIFGRSRKAVLLGIARHAARGSEAAAEKRKEAIGG